MRSPVGYHTTAQPQQLARRRALPALLYAGHPLWRVHRVARHYSHLRSFSVLVSRATLRTNRENVQHRDWPAQRGQRAFTCSSPSDHRGGGRACECECVSVCDLCHERVITDPKKFSSAQRSCPRCLGGSACWCGRSNSLQKPRTGLRATSQQGKMPPLANITEETPRRSPHTVRHPHSAASCARAPP